MQSKGYYILPLFILVINAIICFIFWYIRLKRKISESWLEIVLRIGTFAQFIGFIGLLALLLYLLGILAQLIFNDDQYIRSDYKFWIFWSWAILEIIHHHYYKLIFRGNDTLQSVIENGRWDDFHKPLGGAIGIQLRKVRFHHNCEKDSYRMGA